MNVPRHSIVNPAMWRQLRHLNIQVQIRIHVHVRTYLRVRVCFGSNVKLNKILCLAI